jgi:hypothetical protein
MSAGCLWPSREFNAEAAEIAEKKNTLACAPSLLDALLSSAYSALSAFGTAIIFVGGP